MANGFLGGRDEWDYQPRPVPQRANRSSPYVNPEYGYGDNGLNRTRSQGAGPRPVINVYNDVYNDSINRTEAVPGAFPGGYPGGHNREDYERGRRDQELADEISALRVERSRSRARSRGRSDASPPDHYRYEMERLEREKSWRLEQERIRAEAEVQHLKADARRRQHDIDEAAERRHIIAEYDKKKREEEEQERETEKRIRDKLEREKREAKEKEEAEYNRFLLKQKEEAEKKKREEEEEKHKIEDAMRKRLAEKGFAGNQIEAIISDKKQESTSLTIVQSNSPPVFAKVHKSYLSVETLRYYDIPYKWDDRDGDYIIILREMDKHETNILFEHTRALREGRLLIEAPKKEKEYAFYRKRERSKSRTRDKGEWKSFGILEYKK